MTENGVSPLTSILNHQLHLLGFPNNEHYRYIAMLALIMTLTDSSNLSVTYHVVGFSMHFTL